VGKTALNYRFSRALKKEKNSEPIAMKDLELLRQYQAFLTPHQKGLLDRWVTQCISVALHAFKRIRDGDPHDTVERALVPATTSVGSSAASSSDMLVGSISASATSLPAAGTRPKGNANALGTETKDKLMKFFSKKQRCVWGRSNTRGIRAAGVGLVWTMTMSSLVDVGRHSEVEKKVLDV
jgi:hypothetical protein